MRVAVGMRTVVSALVAGVMASVLLVGCLPASGPTVAGAVVPALEGRIEHVSVPLPGPDRSTQALTTDVANGATVSLIDTDSGQTVSTAVSSDDGKFSVSFPTSFAPAASKPYFLEAVKGLAVGGAANRAGAAIARVRTLVVFNGTWSSLSSGTILISRATTALTVITGHRDLSAADQIALLGKVSDSGFAAAGTAIAAADFDRVLVLVSDALAEDQDPVEAIGYFEGGATAVARFARKAGALVLKDTMVPPRPTAGGGVVFYGQNLPGPGPATPSVRIGTFELAGWTVNATRSELTATVPAGAHGGFLQITQGGTTWTGPFVPVAGTVGTLAGGGTTGFRDGPIATALFSNPPAVAVDSSGNVYASDINNQRIRKITPWGMVTTLAGTGVPGSADGPGSSAQFSAPHGVAVDSAGNVYVGDYGNARIRKISPAGDVSTLAGSTGGYADGTGSAAQFNNPIHVAVDTAGNVYVGDRANHRVRKVTPAGVVTTLAGSGVAGGANGTGTAAQFNWPCGVAVDQAGNVFVAEEAGLRIRKITPAGVVTTLAGAGVSGYLDATGTAAKFANPTGLALDPDGNLYVADYGNDRIRKVTAGGVVTTVAGTGGRGYGDGSALAAAMFSMPYGLAIAPNGALYVADYLSNRIRVFSP